MRDTRARRARVARRAADAASSCQLEAELGVMAANNAFYDAFRDGDSAAMERAWHPNEGECSLIVPGERPIIGRASVLGKWDEVLGNTALPRSTCRRWTDGRAVRGGWRAPR